MNRPLGEYQKNMIDGVLKKYGKYTVKRPIDKQTIRCLNSLVKRGLVTFDAETETYRLKPKPYMYPTRLRKHAANAKLPFNSSGFHRMRASDEGCDDSRDSGGY